jgi:nicotinamidase-related amidase
MKTCLVVDMQNEWIDEKSDYYLGSMDEIKEKTERLLVHCRKNHIPVIFTRHVEPSGDNFKDGTKNTELFVSRNDEPLITKNKISPFYQTSLEELLKKQNTKEIVICGVMTNLCVRSAVADAYDRDYSVTIIKDCCASDSEETDEFTFDDIKKTRPDVDIVTLEEFLNSVTHGL